MNDKCPKCGAYCGLECGCVVAQLRNQLAKAEAEAKRYREAWASVRNQWGNEADIAAGWNVPSGDMLANLLRQCIDDMDALNPPASEGE